MSIEKIEQAFRDHVGKHGVRGRAMFTLDGVRALLAELFRLREVERRMLDAMEKAMDIYQDDAENDIGLAMFMTLYPFLEDKWKAPRALSTQVEERE